MDIKAVRHGWRPGNTPTPMTSVLTALAITCLALCFSAAPATAQSPAELQYGGAAPEQYSSSGQDGYSTDTAIILREIAHQPTATDSRAPARISGTAPREISTLPFTGFDLVYGLILGTVLVLTGVGMRRLVRAP